MHGLGKRYLSLLFFCFTGMTLFALFQGVMVACPAGFRSLLMRLVIKGNRFHG